MNEREANIILRQKARTELALLQRQLFPQNSQAALDHAYELVTKADMVTLINETEFSAEQAKAMLDILYNDYGNHSSNSMDVLVSFMTDKADEYAEANAAKSHRDKEVL